MNTTRPAGSDRSRPDEPAKQAAANRWPPEAPPGPSDDKGGEWMVNLTTGRIYWRPRK